MSDSRSSTQMISNGLINPIDNLEKTALVLAEQLVNEISIAEFKSLARCALKQYDQPYIRCFKSRRFEVEEILEKLNEIPPISNSISHAFKQITQKGGNHSNSFNTLFLQTLLARKSNYDSRAAFPIEVAARLKIIIYAALDTLEDYKAMLKSFEETIQTFNFNGLTTKQRQAVEETTRQAGLLYIAYLRKKGEESDELNKLAALHTKQSSMARLENTDSEELIRIRAARCEEMQALRALRGQEDDQVKTQFKNKLSKLLTGQMVSLTSKIRIESEAVAPASVMHCEATNKQLLLQTDGVTEKPLFKNWKIKPHVCETNVEFYKAFKALSLAFRPPQTASMEREVESHRHAHQNSL